MKTWKIAFLAVALLAVFASGVAVSAQTLQRGEIRGFVYDTTHSVVPSAKLTLSNASTGYHREIGADQDGAYVFAQVLPGVYKLEAISEGFSRITITDINVEIGASLQLDVTLPVKGQTQSVTVSAESTGAIDTSTAGINQIINQKNVENLPLSGRDYRDLAQLSSSAEVVPGLRGGIRLGGQISDYSGLVIDGQDSFNNFFGEYFGSLETKNFSVPLDSVQEFQVVTNGFAPEFGRATGGLINVITKSGTNEVHGTAHYNARAGSFTADDALGNPSNIDLQQQFGGSIGFPIHKNTQFLFLAADFQREHGPLLTNFCSASLSDCQTLLAEDTGPVFGDCFTGDAQHGFLGRSNPAGVLCSAGQVPLPGNVTDGSILPAGCNQSPSAGESVLHACYGVDSLAGFLGSSNQFQNLNTILGHWDWQMTPANHFSIRGYGTRNHTSGFTGGRGQNEIQAGFGNTENFINQGISGSFSLNTVLGRKVNEIRVSIEGETRKRHPNQAAVPQLAFSDNNALDSGIGIGVTVGQRFFLPINNDNGKLQVADNFEYNFGKHDIKFGGDVNPFVDRKDLFAGWSAGEWDFGSLNDFNNNNDGFLIQGFSATAGAPIADLFINGTLRPAYQTGLGLYWQDKWQVTPRFTLTYGVRWDGTWNPQPQTPFGGTTVPIGIGSGANFAAPVPQLIPNDFKQWGPRVGFAWNVGGGDHTTIIRAAWGLYYAQSATIFFPQGGGGKTTQIFGANFVDGFNSGFPYVLATTPSVLGGAPSFTYVDPHFQNPRISSLTAGVERSLTRDVTVTMTGTYVHSSHLRTGGFNEEAWARNFDILGTDQFGRAILGGAPENSNVSSGADALGSFSRGNYESFVVNITKRFTRNFQVFANYNWSQNKDNASSERDTDTFFGPQDPLNLNLDYGRNGLDIKHQFKAAGVWQLPMGFAVSGLMTAHSGTPYPIYVNVDINGDGVSNSGHNNDRPSVLLGNGKEVLLGRYPLSQPGFVSADLRLIKDFGFHERYHVQLQADFFNFTNRNNVFSNPDVSATINYAPFCDGPNNCAPLTGKANKASFTDPNSPFFGVRSINQIAPLSTPFAFQAGAKLIF